MSPFESGSDDSSTSEHPSTSASGDGESQALKATSVEGEPQASTTTSGDSRSTLPCCETASDVESRPSVMCSKLDSIL